MADLTLPVSLRIRGNLERVFTAWVDPQIATLWQCDQLEGDWRPGTTLAWYYGQLQQTLHITDVQNNSLLAFTWKAREIESETQVRIRFTDLGEETGVNILESGWPLSTESVNLIVDHACGWENMLCRLKVWIELKARYSNTSGSFIGCDGRATLGGKNL